MAAAVATPIAATHHAGQARVVPAAPVTGSAAFHPGAPTPAAVVNPEYELGGRKLAGATAVSPTVGLLRYTFTPTSFQLLLSTSCTMASGQYSIAVDGHSIGAGNCPDEGSGGLGNPADPVGSAQEWSGLVHLGRPNTVVMTLVAGLTTKLDGSPLPPDRRTTGSFASAMYQSVPAADYPLPPRPATLQPLEPSGSPVVLDSRRVGADGTFDLPVTVGEKKELDVVADAPGQVVLSAEGHEITVSASWTYTNEIFAGISLDPASLRALGIKARDGERLVVTVTASRFTGPSWLIDANQR